MKLRRESKKSSLCSIRFSASLNQESLSLCWQKETKALGCANRAQLQLVVANWAEERRTRRARGQPDQQHISPLVQGEKAVSPIDWRCVEVLLSIQECIRHLLFCRLRLSTYRRSRPCAISQEAPKKPSVKIANYPAAKTIAAQCRNALIRWAKTPGRFCFCATEM